MPEPETSVPKSEIRRFWGSLYHSLYRDVDANLTREDLLRGLDEMEDMFRFRRHMAAVDMPLADLSGAQVLEIGSGAGAHSALFSAKGAAVVATDITESRVRSTEAKLRLIDEGDRQSFALAADAECLPFAENCFDIVYSNGVLHHTGNTEAAVAEVYRVLKPGGRAVIMLYCKSSWHYWINMWLCVGVLQGKIFGDPNWLGRATEWGGRDVQTEKNPITRCYTAGGVRSLFDRFNDVALRKGEFYFYLIPKLGRFYRRFQIRRYGTHPGGRLVYGDDWPIQSRLELVLGRIMGWSWFISARKPN